MEKIYSSGTICVGGKCKLELEPGISTTMFVLFALLNLYQSMIDNDI
jgi:hypothetical protein